MAELDTVTASPAVAATRIPDTSAHLVQIGGAVRIGWDDVHDLWAARGLLRMLIWRILAIRYKQTLVGSAWAILQPVALMLVFSVFFGLLTRVPTDGSPYPVFFYSGVFLWQFVSQAFNQGSAAIVANAHILTKVYFPRALLPTATVVASLFDALIALPALIVLVACYGISPHWDGLVAFPLAIAIATLLSLGLAFWFSALFVFYRDTAYLLPLLTQIWMFASPIIYPLAVVPREWRPLFAINPMVGVIDITRRAFAGGAPIDPGAIAVSGVASLLLFALGYRAFRRREALFADVA